MENAAQVVLIKTLRLHLTRDGTGWLSALGNNRMRAAITAMHAEPAYSWNLDLLAERAGMSRTRFAVRFKQAVGMPPLDYLRRWRMLLASDRLRDTTESVSAVALSLGYESESALSAALKRVMGASPRHYRQARVPPV